MNLHPFLQKQGIVQVPPFKRPIIDLEQSLQRYNVPLGDTKEMFDGIPLVIGGNERAAFIQLTIDKGKIIAEEEIGLLTTNPDIYFERNYRIIEYLRLEAKNDECFNKTRSKWFIPKEHQLDFYYTLTNGWPILHLNSVIAEEDLKDDISSLCKLLKLRPGAQDNWNVIAAYLLFGEELFADTGALVYCYYESFKIFKVKLDNGFKLLIEVKPSIDYYHWEEIFKVLKPISKEKGFVEADEGITTLKSFSDTNMPFVDSNMKVFAVGKLVKNSWRKKYRIVKEHFKSIYGERVRFGKDLQETAEMAIVELNKAREQNIEFTMKLYKEIAEKINKRFENDKKFKKAMKNQVWDAQRVKLYITRKKIKSFTEEDMAGKVKFTFCHGTL